MQAKNKLIQVHFPFWGGEAKIYLPVKKRVEAYCSWLLGHIHSCGWGVSWQYWLWLFIL